jgi:predicted DsbA family dithiol-disulfide isomerase
MVISVKVTSDFICPWCLIGTVRLRRAIDALPEGMDVDVAWLPFELNPGMPAEGMPRKLYRTRKFGSWERSQALDAQTIAVSKADGVVIDYDRIDKTPNSFAAHRLSWLAARECRQRPVVEALFNAYFVQGQDIGARETLIEIASESGLERARVTAFLQSDEGAGDVRALESSAVRAGVQGVPQFDIEGAIIRGAQSADILQRELLSAHQRKTAAA